MAGSDPIPVEISTKFGLSTSLPESELAPGQLLVARNKAAEKWGPRHGMTLIDGVTRGRGIPTLNGTTSKINVPYNSIQCDLGLEWTCIAYFKPTTVDVEQALFSFGVTQKGGIFAKLLANNKVYVEVQDQGSAVAQLTSLTAVSANDEMMIHLIREGDVVRLFFGVNGAVVLEVVSSGVLSPTQANKVLAEDILIGAPVTGDTAGNFAGLFGALYLYSFASTNFSYSYAEAPCIRGAGVLMALTGELIESDALVEDASRMQNHATVSNVIGGTRFLDIHEPVQAITHHTSIDGRERNVVIAGGKLYGRVV